MNHRSAIVIAIDGLRASALGAYGNAWQPTPALDSLASQSLTVDWMWCDSPGLDGFYRAVWQGTPAKSSANTVTAADEVASTLPRRLAAVGVYAALTTDDPWVAAEADARQFAEVRHIEAPATEPAATVADTALAQLVAIAVDQLVAWATPGSTSSAAAAARLLWVHARGFHGPWDAPLALRQQVLDEEDPPPAEFVEPPACLAVDDHDALLLVRAAYAAQAAVLDECIDALVAALSELGLDQETLVVLVGTRGFALGEHGHVGGECRSLYSELLHVPCLVRQPEGAAPPPRSSRLAQPGDLHSLLCEWFGLHEGGVVAEPRHWMLSNDDGATTEPQAVRASGDRGEQALRTHAWMLRRQRGVAGSPDQVELYAKPDDRWEANEVADRCADVVDELLAELGPAGRSSC